MSQSTLAISSSQIDKNLCEAYGCYKEATTQISVGVGELGTFELNLCKSCVPRFTDENELCGFNKKISALEEHQTEDTSNVQESTQRFRFYTY
jgi:hypothetical protein